MRNYNLIKSILTEPWYISPEQARGMVPVLMGVFHPDKINFEEKSGDRADSVRYNLIVPRGAAGDPGRIGVVEITGPLYKYDSICDFGMLSYASFIREHENDPDVEAILLVIDSPGGSVAGTIELCQAIESCSKPVVAFVSDSACSAAYRICASCRQVIANNDMANVGSIGVMCTYTDMSEYYAKMGIKTLDIYAPESSEKNDTYREMLKGNTAPTEQRLSAYAQDFHQAVKKNRPGVTKDQLSGKVYFAKDVVGTLIDDIDTLQGACSVALELAGDERGSTETNQSEKNMSKQNAYIRLAAAAGVSTLESADGDITLNPEQCQAIESHLVELEQTAEAAAGTATELTAAQARIAELEAENTRLQELPGDEHSSVEKETDAPSEEATGDDFAANLKNAIDFSTKYGL